LGRVIKEAVTLSDAYNKPRVQKKNWSKAAAPVFDNVIELKRRALDGWHKIPAGREIRV
jgi:hypothetical protein